MQEIGRGKASNYFLCQEIHRVGQPIKEKLERMGLDIPLVSEEPNNYKKYDKGASDDHNLS